MFVASAGRAQDNISLDDLPKCDADTKFLSEEWALSKVSCGIDAALKKGKSMATDLGMQLLAAAFDSYVPGLSSLFMGGREGPDPLAVATERILDSIDQAKDDILQGILLNVKDETLLVQWPHIREDLSDAMSCTFDAKLGLFEAGFQTQLDFMMDEARIRIQNREDVFGLDALHTLATLTSLQLKFKPEYMYLAVLQGKDLTADEVETLTPEEQADIEADARFDADAQIREILVGHTGTLRYFERIASENRYRRYSYDAFGEVDLDHLGGFLTNSVTGSWITVSYEIEDTVTQWDPNTLDATRGNEVSPYPIKVECVEHHSVPQTSNGPADQWCDRILFTLTLPDGGVRSISEGYSCDPYKEVCARRVIDPAPIFTLQELHKQWMYEQTLLSAYGPLRGIIDLWYTSMGQTPPIFQADRDLEALILGSDGASRELSLLKEHSLDMREPSALERRRIANAVYRYGWPSLAQLRFSETLHDPLAPRGRPMADYVSLLSASAGPNGFEPAFKGTFAAKFMVL